MSALAPEDAVVVAEVLRRLCDVVGGLSGRADGNINASEFYEDLLAAYHSARAEADSGGAALSGGETDE